ncbi:MAG TPA: polysaccharide biosynthesis tyrosine autokinase [Acidimicrobiales bacterium]|nr:polysaccharide biosynthesis tyrosine autokinase [Acidimicrobiales bacterium]
MSPVPTYGTSRVRTGTEIRIYRDILRRHRLLIVAAPVIAAALAALVTTIMTPVYTARAKVLLRPGDPAEELYTDRSAGRPAVDSDRYVSAHLDIVESRPVAREASRLVGGSVDQLLRKVWATQSRGTDVIAIAARDADPARAAEIANAFSRSYIENRRTAAVAGLERASEQIDVRLGELEKLMTATAAPPAGEPPAPAVQATSDEYKSLSARRQELLVTKSLKRGEAELIAEAEVPLSPSSPDPLRDSALSGLAGLLAGLGYAVVREQLDDRLHSREQAEEAAQLPVLAEVPLDTESKRGDIAAHDRPDCGVAEAARGLRTGLTFVGVDAPLRRIAVTSSGISEGKSFLAVNLAVVYAQAGYRTLLVSGDLRRPYLDSLFPEAAHGPGLSEAVAGYAQEASSSNGKALAPDDRAAALGIRPTRVEGLFFLPAGRLPPNPAELLGSKRAAQLFEALSLFADVVVVDTPPVLVTDAAVMASNMDGVLLLAVPGQTKRDALALATNTISSSRARLLGVVLNKVKGQQTPYYGSPQTAAHAPVASGSRRSRRRAARRGADAPAPGDVRVGSR